MQSTVISRLTWRLMPFLLLLYIVAYLDRINVGFAALQMRGELKFSDNVYGLGAGMFFAGYFLFQVPSNLVLQRVGARRWMCILMMVWGVISSSMILVSNAREFYLLRFLLGAAEAGFFPGMILYFKSWFPEAGRARTVGLFMTAGPISGFIGGPISGVLLNLHHLGGLSGWQWLFLLEGLPAVLLGAVVYFVLVDKPDEAKWLTPEQKSWLSEELEREKRVHVAETRASIWDVLASPGIWLCAFVYFGLNTCTYGISLWLPTLIKSISSGGNLLVGFVSAIPYLLAAVTMVLVGLHSDRSAERRWHVAIPAFVGGAALLMAAFSTSLVMTMVAISLAFLSANSMTGPFWAIPTSFLQGTAAAAGIAFINSIGNLGGFFGPTEIGYLRNLTGSFRGGFLVAGGTLALCGFLILLVRIQNARRFS